MSHRIQCRRDRPWQTTPKAVYVGRPSRWGNRFPVETYGREEALRLFEDWLRGLPADERESYLAPQRCQALACWCALYDKNGVRVPCHADMLLSWANDIPLEDICAALIMPP